MRKMRFTSKQRLRHAYEFQAVKKSPHRVHCGAFILQALFRGEDSLGGVTRLGVIASRRVGNAVVRNRAKRVFREIFRKNQGVLVEGMDLVVVVRSEFAQYSVAELEGIFLKNVVKLAPES